MRWLDRITESMVMNLSKLQETVKDREAMGSQRVSHGLATEQQQQSQIVLSQNLSGEGPRICIMITRLPHPPPDES